MIEYEFRRGHSPLLVAAIHEGHKVRPELLPYFKLLDSERLREEDPYTVFLTSISDQQLIVRTSRFETDLNRPPEKAVYRKPEDAWGLELYNKELPSCILSQSKNNYYTFYAALKESLQSVLQRHDWLVVYDLHSYNHRREGIDRYASPSENPEINIGTGHMDPSWRPVVDQLMETMRAYNYQGRQLDVRENVKFSGGYFSQWLNENFGAQVCPLAIEFKKFFMNEWTGEVDMSQLHALRNLLISTIHPVLETSQKIKSR